MDDRRNTSGLDVLLAVWSRRKWLAILAFVGPFAVAVSLAIALPHLYRSTATLLLERPQVLETFVKSSVTSELETRLHTISKEILSRSRLQELIMRFDLYPEFRKRATLEEVVERMRRDIRMEFKGHDIRMEPKESTVVVPQGGSVAAIAFTLSFRGRDPETVANVTNTLASLFVEENLKLRERQAAGTAEFLRVQLEEMKRKLDQEEQRVGEFKERHLGELPEQTPVNLAILERLNMELRLNKENQIRVMEWFDQEDLTRQLAMASKNAPVRDPTDTTPVRDPTDPPTGPIAIAARIAWLNQELTELRTRFSEKYPDVIRVKAEIAALERQLAETKNSETSETKADSTANSYPSRLKKGRSAAAVQLSALKEQEKSLRQAIAMYQRRVDHSPRLEQEYQGLFGDYKTMKEHYSALLQRYQEALVAASMEHVEKGDQVRLLDVAIPSTRPAAPNPLRLIVIGLILSMGLAGGAVWLIEHRDTSFHTLNELRAFTKVPVLASIPPIVTKTDTSRWHRRFWLGTAASLIGLAILIGTTHHIAQGNEQLVWMLDGKRT
jgi:succinoglycan biosynthesis transport protein ExoP